MPDARDLIELDSNTLEQGYESCRISVNRYYRDFLWIIGNLPRNQRRWLNPLLQHGIRTADLLNLESTDGKSLEVWQEIRRDLKLAFADQYVSAELAALVDTVRHHNIDQSLILAPLDGADRWIRQRTFQTYDELTQFASQMGGSLLAAAVPVLGFIKSDYQAAAIECGKAIVLTHLLANFVNDLKVNKNFLAKDDLDECEIVVHRLKLRQGGPSLKHLVRLYCWRIEKSLTEGGKLVSYLDYDARRSVTSLLSLNWKMLMQMKLEPDSLLREDGVLTPRDKFKLRTRHLLGIEGNGLIG